MCLKIISKQMAFYNRFFINTTATTKYDTLCKIKLYVSFFYQVYTDSFEIESLNWLMI